MLHSVQVAATGMVRDALFGMQAVPAPVATRGQLLVCC
jgi:hypothetical protein